jgi:hypothetical protein
VGTINQPSAWPTRKVTAATFGALAASVAADIVIGFLPATSTVDPAELSLLIEYSIVTLGTFGLGWRMSERAT